MKDTRRKEFCLSLFLVVFTLNAWSNIQRDSIVIDSRWSNSYNEGVSDDGRWATVGVKRKLGDDVYLVNTVTQKEIKFENIKKPTVINDLLFFQTTDDGNMLNIMNLEDDSKKFISQVEQFIPLIKMEAIAYIQTETNAFTIEKFVKGELIKIFQDTDVSDFYFSEDQRLVMIIKSNNRAFVFDLVTMQESYITELDKPIKYVVWNENQDKVAATLTDNKVWILDLVKKNKERILLDSMAYQVTPVFLPNNDLFLKYTLNEKVPNNFIEYLDIWNGNDKDLESKHNFKKDYLKTFKHVFYRYNLERMDSIELKKNSLPILIGNPNKVLIYNPIELKDYSSYIPKVNLDLLNITNGDLYRVVDSVENISRYLSYAPNGKYLSYVKDRKIFFFDVETLKHYKLEQIDKPQEVIWSDNNEDVFLINNNSIWRYSLKTKLLVNLHLFEDEDYKINVLNQKIKSSRFYQAFGLRLKYSLSNAPLLVHAVNLKDNSNDILLVYESHIEKVVSKNEKKIHQVKWSEDYKTITFSEEHFDKPTSVKCYSDGEIFELFKSSLPKDLYSWRRQKVIDFTDKCDVPLKGILYYPKIFNEGKRYPMITVLYEKQYYLANKFFLPSVNESTGINIPLLLEEGYFVFLPDTNVSDEGPGISALHNVESAIEKVLKLEPAIDMNKLGLIGNSYGGYLTNFIITQSNIFSAAISGVGVSDIVNEYYSYNYNSFKPYYWIYENGQYQMKGSFSDNPELYLRNNPILFAQNIKTPLLSYTGMEDFNVHWENTRHFYIALKRYNIPHIALFYKNEGHAITSSRASKDLFYRILDWFDFYLKDDKNINWIRAGVK